MERFGVDHDVGQGGEIAHGTPVADDGVIQGELLLGVTIDALGTGALAVDGLVERSIAVQGDAHLRPGFPIEILDAALAFAKLLVLASDSRGIRKEQGAAKALRAVAGGMGELVSRMHPQADRTQWNAISSSLPLRVTMLIERDSRNAPAKDAGLVDIPGIKGSIRRDVSRKESQVGDGLQIEGHKIGDVVLIEGVGILSEDYVPIVGGSGTGNAGAIAPQVLFDLDAASHRLAPGWSNV